MTGHDMTSEEMIDSGGRGQPAPSLHSRSSPNKESKEAQPVPFSRGHCVAAAAAAPNDAATSVDLRPVKGSRKRGPACPPGSPIFSSSSCAALNVRLARAPAPTLAYLHVERIRFIRH